MPKVRANGIDINYEVMGSGEPLVMIPFLTADNACYAFQFGDYSKHFTVYSIDPRGAGLSCAPWGPYSTEQYADDVAAFMDAVGLQKAHIAGLSLGAATTLAFGAKYPDRAKSLSAHSGWTKTELFMNILVNGWTETARVKQSVVDTAIGYIFTWCLTPDLFATNPAHIMGLVDFVKSRPAQTVAGFLGQCDAVLSHDIEGKLGAITAPTLLTFGEVDMITPVSRFADKMKSGIKNSELHIFKGCAHAPLYEKTQEFNDLTLNFLKKHIG
ncbi:MAG: alpha/beta fold hydrolase [Deltaproteobacteria bacterium]